MQREELGYYVQRGVVLISKTLSEGQSLTGPGIGTGRDWDPREWVLSASNSSMRMKGRRDGRQHSSMIKPYWVVIHMKERKLGSLPVNP